MKALEQVQQLLAAYADDWQTPEENRIDAAVLPTSLLAAVKALDDARWGYLTAITGLDYGQEVGAMEVLYHFCANPAVLTLRVQVSYQERSVPSIFAIIPYACVFERELHEMFGIEVTGTPDTSRLLLPDDWPEGVYPLCKDTELD